MTVTLEACVDSLESARAAERGGATRFELCSALVIGGITPPISLLRAVKREIALPVHALLRPRFGDFLYTEAEFSLMLEDAALLLEEGADAIVSGCLLPDGSLDLPRMERLTALAHGRGGKFTLHRAFDVCRDPLKALADCRELGVDTILTSGQENSCVQGIPLLRELFREAGPVEILVGAGVDAAAVRRVRGEIPAAHSFHMSGKTVLESGMEYRKAGVSMGLPAMSEFELWRTGETKIREAWKELNKT